MKGFKRANKGFTLVELIVVIAIIGVLAAILVPALMGYVSDSKVSSANTNAKAVYTAVSRIATNQEARGYSMGDGRIYKQTASGSGAVGGHINYTGSGSIFTAIDKELGAGSTWVYYVEMKDGLPETVYAAKTISDRYVGSYPKPAEGKCTNSLNSIGSGPYSKSQSSEDILG